MKTTVAFVITGLYTGGAELMLLKLLEHLDRTRFSPFVISLTERGDIGPRIEALGIPVIALGMRPSAPNPAVIFRLAKYFRQLRPHIVHTWMYHADLVGGLAAKLAGISNVIWGIRNSNLDPDKTKWSTRAVAQGCAWFSHWLPTRILSCSTDAVEVHRARGYASSKMAVIPNGFDLRKFKPDPMARASVRNELGLADNNLLVGLVGRFDPQKNQLGFIQAAGWVKQANPHVHFVMVGANLAPSNTRLIAAAQEANILDSLHLLGMRKDMPRIMASFDVLALTSSYGEAFPNVLGEAMACGVPCVVTDVGDCTYIVGDTGRVVAVGDMRAMAEEIMAMLNLSPSHREQLGNQCRIRINDNFEISMITRKYAKYYANPNIDLDNNFKLNMP